MSNYPFLLCKCNRGSGVVDENHVCEIIDHDNQLKYFDRSKKRWERRKSNNKKESKEIYTIKDHADWVDNNNFGVSHFGLSPLLLKRENIRFDVFHLCVAITKRLMVIQENLCRCNLVTSKLNSLILYQNFGMNFIY